MQYTHKEFAAFIRDNISPLYKLSGAFGPSLTLDGAVRIAWFHQLIGMDVALRHLSPTDMETFFLLVADALEAGDIDPPGYAVTLAIGDVVILDKERTKSVVTGCKMSEDGSVKYTVSGCGLYSRNRLRLVQRADYASLEYATLLE